MIGNLWWEMHEECMVVCAEALLPLAITAVFTTGGPHNSQHAKWGKGSIIGNHPVTMPSRHNTLFINGFLVGSTTNVTRLLHDRGGVPAARDGLGSRESA